MRGKVALAAAAIGAAALLLSGGCDGGGGDTEPDGGASDYVSPAPPPGPPSIDINNPNDCSPRGGAATIRVTRLAPSALTYSLQVSWFNDRDKVVLDKDLNPKDGAVEVTFNCTGKAKGHYRVVVEGAGHTVESAFDVYPYKP